MGEFTWQGRWQFVTFTTNMGLIKNHVLLLIGGIKIQDFTPKDIDLMFDSLRSKKVSGSKGYNKTDEEKPCLSSTTLRHIYILLKKAFDKAVTWKLIQSNPVTCEAPKKNKGKRNIWDAETFRMVLNDMEEPLLHLAVHMAFICSLRSGETLGLTWDCIDFEKKLLQHRQNSAASITGSAFKTAKRQCDSCISPEDGNQQFVSYSEKSQNSCTRISILCLLSMTASPLNRNFAKNGSRSGSRKQNSTCRI